MIPSKFKIGVSEYDVELVECVDKDENLLGQISYNNLKIKIDKTYPEQTQELTFWHEVAHGIFHEISEDKLRVDERLVDQVGRMIYGILKDNGYEIKNT